MSAWCELLQVGSFFSVALKLVFFRRGVVCLALVQVIGRLNPFPVQCGHTDGVP